GPATRRPAPGPGAAKPGWSRGRTPLAHSISVDRTRPWQQADRRRAGPERANRTDAFDVRVWQTRRQLADRGDFARAARGLGPPRPALGRRPKTCLPFRLVAAV